MEETPVPQDVDSRHDSTWTESREIDRLAFRIVIRKAALTFWKLPDETIYDPEKLLLKKWHSVAFEEREAALERALNHFVGGAMRGTLENLKRHPLNPHVRRLKPHPELWEALKK